MRAHLPCAGAVALRMPEEGAGLKFEPRFASSLRECAAEQSALCPESKVSFAPTLCSQGTGFAQRFALMSLALPWRAASPRERASARMGLPTKRDGQHCYKALAHRGARAPLALSALAHACCRESTRTAPASPRLRRTLAQRHTGDISSTRRLCCAEAANCAAYALREAPERRALL